MDKKQPDHTSQKAYFYLALTVASIAYVITGLLAPLGPNRFNLTPAKTHWLQLSIYLPIVVIWWIAAFGAERFKSYTSGIRNHKDGYALDKISTGLVILVASIILSGLFSVVRAWAAADGWLSAFTIMSNYLAVIGPLIAYSYLYAGSRDLCGLIKKKPADIKRVLALIIFLALLAGIFILALLTYDYLNSTPDAAKHSSFYMSAPLTFLTIGLPYLIGWGLAIKAALNIADYRRQVKGVIYKAMLLRLVIGIFTVVGFYFVIQLLFAFSTFFARAGLGAILLAIYLLILAYAIGFLIIASGANKLMKIEDV